MIAVSVSFTTLPIYFLDLPYEMAIYSLATGDGAFGNKDKYINLYIYIHPLHFTGVVIFFSNVKRKLLISIMRDIL